MGCFRDQYRLDGAGHQACADDVVNVHMERETGIEPASLAWKARVLPLNYSRHAPGPTTFIALSSFQPDKVSLVEEGGFEPP